MKIAKIIVKNFRSIKDAEITPGNFNIFVGQNNHGKTLFTVIVPEDKQYQITNNGELIFTYAEAASMGITKRQFAAGLSDLVEKGLLDITRTGRGQFKLVTLYALSNRWRLWGTKQFEQNARIPAPRTRRQPPKFAILERAG